MAIKNRKSSSQERNKRNLPRKTSSQERNQQKALLDLAAARLVKNWMNQIIKNFFQIHFKLLKIIIICKKVQNQTNNEAKIN